VSLMRSAAFVLVPLEVRARAAEVYDGTDVINVDDLLQSRWRQLRTAVDSAMLHRMEVVADYEMRDLTGQPNENTDANAPTDCSPVNSRGRRKRPESGYKCGERIFADRHGRLEPSLVDSLQAVSVASAGHDAKSAAVWLGHFLRNKKWRACCLHAFLS